jgi:parvulin-like peptidyl-prolyl isomerase
MKNLRFLSFFLALIAWEAFLAAPAPRAEVVERILAVVNDEIVTEQDLQVMMAPVVAQFRTTYRGPELEEKLGEVRSEFLHRIIEDRLVLSEAKRRQVIVKDIEVDEMMADVRNKFPSRELFLHSLEEQGLSEKKLWNRFRDQLMTQKLINFEVKSRILVSPGEVNAYYKAHPDLFEHGDQVKLQHILVRIGARSEEDALEFAQSLVTQIKGGKPFEELARDYSEGAEAKEGGEMGWVERGHFLGEIDEKIFALSEGETTSPIKSSLGYHIFKVTERQKVSVKPLTQVRAEIQDRIFKTKLRQRLDAWIENLKENAYISVR